MYKVPLQRGSFLTSSFFCFQFAKRTMESLFLSSNIFFLLSFCHFTVSWILPANTSLPCGSNSLLEMLSFSDGEERLREQQLHLSKNMCPSLLPHISFFKD